MKVVQHAIEVNGGPWARIEAVSIEASAEALMAEARRELAAGNRVRIKAVIESQTPLGPVWHQQVAAY